MRTSGFVFNPLHTVPQKTKNHIITVRTEHKCVLESCRALEGEGFEVTYLPVQKSGRVDMAELEAAIRPETVLISVMAVNNEIGTVQPLEEIGKLCRSKGVFFHTGMQKESVAFFTTLFYVVGRCLCFNPDGWYCGSVGGACINYSFLQIFCPNSASNVGFFTSS